MGAVVIQTTTESHSSVAQAGLEFPSQPCVSPQLAATYWHTAFAHLVWWLMLPFVYLSKVKRKSSEKLCFLNGGSFWASSKGTFIKRSRWDLWEERWQWGAWGWLPTANSSLASIPEAVLRVVQAGRAPAPFLCVPGDIVCVTLLHTDCHSWSILVCILAYLVQGSHPLLGALGA